MAHEIAEANGKAAMAYNVKAGVPWHKLGQPMAGLQTLDAMLEAAQADFDVFKTPVYVQDPESGQYVEIPDRFATARINPDNNTIHPFEVVKSRYNTINNREIGEKGLAIVEASKGDCVIETMACLYDFKRFFVVIDMGGLIIDPNGVADEISRYLLCSTSHDGRMPVTYAQTDIRVVCANTERMALRNAKATFTARHTPSWNARMEEAQQVLGISTEWAKAFKEEAERLLTIPMSIDLLQKKVIDKLWDPEKADTPRKQAKYDDTSSTIRKLYLNNRNVGKVGHNGWAAYNAFTEFFDHYYNPARETAHKASLMDTESLVSKKKIEAHALVAALGR